MKRKRIAIICKTAGIMHRGGESFAIELGNYLQRYYDVDMYTESKIIDGFHGQVCTVVGKTGRIMKWYDKLYQKVSAIRKFVQCSRYTSIFYPGSIESYEWGKEVFKKIEKEGSYDVIYPISGPGCHFLAKRYRQKKKCPFFVKGGAESVRANGGLLRRNRINMYAFQRSNTDGHNSIITN